LIDTKKRNTLKTIAVSGAAVISSSLVSLAVQASKKSTSIDGIELKVEHNSVFGSNYLVVTNNSNEDSVFNFTKGDSIDLPLGRYSLDRLALNGDIAVSARSSKVFSLDEIQVASNRMYDTHSTLRFPVRDHVIVDNVVIQSNSSGALRTVGVELMKGQYVA
jgi:hypothetical protein